MEKTGNAILKRFFSKSTFNSLWMTGKSRVFDYTVQRYVGHREDATYLDLVREIYAYMGKEYRSEYYYKNVLLNKLLFLKHDYRTTVALTELPIAGSKADFILINGRGVVYEIKTELDNLERLDSQVRDYFKAFSEVYVVTFQENIEKVREIIPAQAGIIELTRRNALKEIRAAQNTLSSFDYETIFKILRKYEFERILLSEGISLPEVDQFHYYQACYQLICNIDICVLQKMMLKALKDRQNLVTSERSYQGPDELRFLLYFDDNKVLSTNQINRIMEQTYGG